MMKWLLIIIIMMQMVYGYSIEDNNINVTIRENYGQYVAEDDNINISIGQNSFGYSIEDNNINMTLFIFSTFQADTGDIKQQESGGGSSDIGSALALKNKDNNINVKGISKAIPPYFYLFIAGILILYIIFDEKIIRKIKGYIKREEEELEEMEGI